MELDAHETTQYRARDKFGEIRVAERGLIRFLYFGHDTQQSATLKGHTHALIMKYAQAMSLVLLFNPAPKRVLIVGLGGGSLVNFFLATFPDVLVEVIELRPAVVEIAHTYFHLTDGPEVVYFVAGAMDLGLDACGAGTQHRPA